MKAADDVKFSRALVDTLLGTMPDFFQRKFIGAGRVFVAPESAQLAMSAANVGRIDVAVHVEVANVTMALLTNVVGEPTDRKQIAGLIEEKAVRGIQTLAGEDLVGYRFQARVGDLEVGFHQRIMTVVLSCVGLRQTCRCAPKQQEQQTNIAVYGEKRSIEAREVVWTNQ